MKREIKLQDTIVEYTLRVSARARRMRLAVYHTGVVVVTAPQVARLCIVGQFMVRKARWVLGKLEDARKNAGRIIIKDTRREYLQHKESARSLAVTRMTHFNTVYNFSWSRIAVRNQKSRWGSCSKKGNINFNYKIALLPAHLADYVIVHEMCHLGEFNDSQKFWDLVAKAYPNHKEARSELRKISVAGY